MFEMSSGTLVFHPKYFGDNINPQFLLDVVRSCYDDDKKATGADKLIDPLVGDHIDMKSFHVFNKIAHECISLKLEERPTMDRIIRRIQRALHITQLNDHESASTITTRSLESFLIPLEDINLATKNFNHETCIRDFYYGAVHRGQLIRRWQNQTMAITRFYPKNFHTEDQFYKELRIISSFHHQNISPFIGYCDESNERIISTEALQIISKTLGRRVT
uniref:Serine-threonine/tyrosine-protein kinase catalytic domain-containing protein n=1 Tax=Lactuca sativa TaxID=4236 RepID=A0A9R1WMS1_LACSA|nr:hypothetical protein LSAT_V11C100033150 [Lactuca sativa]